jgi:hypothetical protein
MHTNTARRTALDLATELLKLAVALLQLLELAARHLPK